MLQKMSELMENSELLDKAAECDVRSASFSLDPCLDRDSALITAHRT